MIKRDWLGIIVQGVVVSIIILAMAAVLSSFNGQAELVRRVDRNAQTTVRALHAVTCILHIPPLERTDKQADACLEAYGFDPDSLEVPPRSP